MRIQFYVSILIDQPSVPMSSHLVPREIMYRAARRFKILSEPVRLEILSLLHERGEMSVQELVEETGQHQANISKHLGHLAAENCVKRRKQGLYAYYSINDPTLSSICMLVCGRLRQEADAA